MTFFPFRLRVPLSVQNSRPEAAGRLQREWVSLLERHCQPGSAAPLPLQGSQGCSSPEADYEEFVVPPNEQEEESPHLGGSCARSSLSKPPAPLAAPAAALPPATGRAEVPPAPPALPQPCSLPPAAKRTKAFHWDVVPCDKVRMKLRAAVKGKKTPNFVARVTWVVTGIQLCHKTAWMSLSVFAWNKGPLFFWLFVYPLSLLYF